MILHAIGGDLDQNEMIGKLIKQADYALLATVLYVLALGLYSLFVDDRVPMPRGCASTTSVSSRSCSPGSSWWRSPSSSWGRR